MIVVFAGESSRRLHLAEACVAWLRACGFIVEASSAAAPSEHDQSESAFVPASSLLTRVLSDATTDGTVLSPVTVVDGYDPNYRLGAAAETSRPLSRIGHVDIRITVGKSSAPWSGATDVPPTERTLHGAGDTSFTIQLSADVGLSDAFRQVRDTILSSESCHATRQHQILPTSAGLVQPIDFLVSHYELFVDQLVTVVGRVTKRRRQARSTFLDLSSRGALIQLLLGTESSERLPGTGDLVEFTGRCDHSKTGAKTIMVESFRVVSPWQSDVGYSTVARVRGRHPLHSFTDRKYARLRIAYTVRQSARAFLSSLGFIEVQTPIILDAFNGGRSFPATAVVNSNRLGFLRTTLEERLQAVIGSGFERVFSVGSIFRSTEEHSFVEAYAVGLTWAQGEDLARRLIAAMVTHLSDGRSGDSVVAALLKNEWQTVNFLDAASVYLGGDAKSAFESVDGARILLARGVLPKQAESVEAAADMLAAKIATDIGGPVAIRGYPRLASPIYAFTDDDSLDTVQRTRGFIPGVGGGFDAGIAETNVARLRDRIGQQRAHWTLDDGDPRVGTSDLVGVAAGGLPHICGVGLNVDRIARVVDPYSCWDPFDP
jgi:lysyl-tRNA synthetase class II